jgi:hypothetical protein
MKDAQSYIEWEQTSTIILQQMRHIPSHLRSGLGDRIVYLCINTLEELALCQTQTPKRKLDTLRHIDQNIIKLKALIRQLYYLQVISQKKRAHLQEKLIISGKMIGAWLKYCKQHSHQSDEN